MFFNDRVDCVRDLLVLQDIGHDRVQVGGVLADGGQSLLVASNNDHFCTSGSEMLGEFKSKALRPAGDCDDFVLLVAHAVKKSGLK